MRSAEAEKRLAAVHRRVGELLDGIDQGMPLKGIEEGRVTRITLRLPTEESPEALLIVKAVVGEDKRIAFIGGLGIIQALLTWRAKEGGPGLKWRADVPWELR